MINLSVIDGAASLRSGYTVAVLYGADETVTGETVRLWGDSMRYSPFLHSFLSHNIRGFFRFNGKCCVLISAGGKMVHNGRAKVASKAGRVHSETHSIKGDKKCHWCLIELKKVINPCKK